MSNIIKLLPDAVANQIAAGEVVQRPASVVKELMENAVDAGGSIIHVVIKEAGRTLVQVIDNGCGMSETDARMAFERHATSKIKEAADLYAIETKGFRGEALASIAAVAHVELRTRAHDEELGTLVTVAASKFEDQETVHCPVGSNFAVRNLFFNVPARRRFLKQNTTEFRHILNEFERVVLAHPEIEFSLTHNDIKMFSLPASNRRQRIVNLVGKQLNAALLPLGAETPFVQLTGFIGTPSAARKTAGEQYFFANNRFIKHNYLHKAVLEAFDKLIPADSYPTYYIYLDVDPQTIDINIHPTKTEIKFEDDRTIWHVINAAVRESLGKHNIVPSIDFDTEGFVGMPVTNAFTDAVEPLMPFNPDFNPFDLEKSHAAHIAKSGPAFSPKASAAGWDDLYNGFETETFSSKMLGSQPSFNSESVNTNVEPVQQQLAYLGNTSFSSANSGFFQYKGRFILSSSKSGLMMFDQKRAHERILYERFLKMMENHRSTSQQILFPEVLTFKAEDAILLSELVEELQLAGIDLEENEDGDFEVRGLPSDLEGVAIRPLLESILEDYKSSEYDAALQVRERIAGTLARNAAIPYGKALSGFEMQEMFDLLFACSTPNFSPDGKTIVSIVPHGELEARFN
jgi:DNA mismatch repair protein MutL